MTETKTLAKGGMKMTCFESLFGLGRTITEAEEDLSPDDFAELIRVLKVRDLKLTTNDIETAVKVFNGSTDGQLRFQGRTVDEWHRIDAVNTGAQRMLDELVAAKARQISEAAS
jgi:hypothetical protein